MQTRTQLLLLLIVTAAVTCSTNDTVSSKNAEQLDPSDPVDSAAAASQACMKNLREIYQSLELYKGDTGRYPDSNGVAFLTSAWTKGSIKRVAASAGVFHCPGDSHDSPFDASGDIRLNDEIDSSMVSYAGRNQTDFPINFFERATEVIASDDDEHGHHHPGVVHVLYMDGRVEAIDIRHLGDTPFRVGPDSPLEQFRVLSNTPLVGSKPATVTTLAEMEAIYNALEMFEIEYGRIPARLGELMEPPLDRDSYFADASTDFRDAWGNHYRFSIVEGNPQLRSLGADCRDGGSNDDADLVWPRP